MVRVFIGETADLAWSSAARAFRDGDGPSLEQTRLGESHEILHAALSIQDPRQRWVVSRQPVINVAFSLAELVWIINGRNDSQFLNYFNRALPKYAGAGCCYHGAYGYRLKYHFGIDQIEHVYNALRSNPTTRQAVLQIWDPRADLPDESGSPVSPDIPCNVVAFLKIRDGKLHWTQVMRANDLFRGTPYNLVQFTSLQEILAGWLDLELGSYDLFTDSLHVYSCDLESALRFVTEDTPPRNTDSLAFSREESQAGFRTLAQAVEFIIASSTSAYEIVDQVTNCQLPESFRNILCVLAAEGARRRGEFWAWRAALHHCTNPLYRHLSEKWLSRVMVNPPRECFVTPA